MRSVIIKNAYGYPALSPKIRKYAERKKYKIVLSMYNVDPTDESMKIIIAGLPFLKSTHVPIIGYEMFANGAWYRKELPGSLKPNEFTMKLPNFQRHPTHEQMWSLFVNNEVPEDMSSRFKTYHQLQDLNERVFGGGSKEKEKPDAE